MLFYKFHDGRGVLTTVGMVVTALLTDEFAGDIGLKIGFFQKRTVFVPEYHVVGISVYANDGNPVFDKCGNFINGMLSV